MIKDDGSKGMQLSSHVWSPSVDEVGFVCFVVVVTSGCGLGYGRQFGKLNGGCHSDVISMDEYYVKMYCFG